jgi:hypothetical protein
LNDDFFFSAPQLKRDPLGSMQPNTSASEFEEPLRRTLARNVALAAGVGVVFALQGHSLRLLLPITALALWFSLGGHYVELAFLNGLRARLSKGRLTHVALRLVVWFAGGAVLYVLMAASAWILPLEAPPLRMWWYGGLLLIGVELAVHGLLAMRGKPNFYSGRG